MLRSFTIIIFAVGFFSSPWSLGADLELEPVTLFKCWRALRKLNTPATPTIPQELTKKGSLQALKVPTYKYLHTEQLQNLFHLSAEEGQGLAKGLTYRTVDGTLTSLFWPAKKNGESSISEREAIDEILKSELRAIENYLSKPRNEKLQFLLDAKENLSFLVGKMKDSHDIPGDIAERFFGFQMNLKKSANGEVAIANVDFNPALNGKSSIGSVLGWQEEFQAVIDKISSSIASKHRPVLYRVDHTVFNTLYGPLKLKAPPGSQIIEVSGN